MKRNSISLMEFCSVVAIAGFVSAILFPVFEQAKESNRATVCLSNARQLGLAYDAYLSDNSGFGPCGYSTSASGNGWANQLYPFAKNTSAFHCPSDGSVLQQGFGSSYAMNSNLFISDAHAPWSWPVDFKPGPGRARNQIADPAKMVLMCEVQNSNLEDVSLYDTEYMLTGSDPSNANAFRSDIQCASYGGTNCAQDPGGGPHFGLSPVGFGIGGDQYNSYDPNGANAIVEFGQPIGDNGNLKYATGLMQNSGLFGGGFIAAIGRHLGGSNFVLDDGHVKHLLPGDVSPGYPTTWTTGGTQCGFVGGGNYVYASDSGCTTMKATFSYN